jgi:5-methylcytosine-specific restriction endonuclease McrA
MDKSIYRVKGMFNFKRTRFKGCGPVKILSASGAVKQLIPISEFKNAPVKNRTKKDRFKKSLQLVPDSRISIKYNNWRRAVLSRDGYKCVLCGSSEQVQAHHIIRWADSEYLRFNQTNGVALCFECHDNGHNHNKEKFPKNTTAVLLKYIDFKYAKAKLKKFRKPQPDYNASYDVNSVVNKNVPAIG